MVAHVLIPGEQSDSRALDVGIGIVKEIRIILVEMMEVSICRLLPEGLACLLMVDTVKAIRLQDFVDPQNVAILLGAVALVYIAVEVADD